LDKLKDTIIDSRVIIETQELRQHSTKYKESGNKNTVVFFVQDCWCFA